VTVLARPILFRMARPLLGIENQRRRAHARLERRPNPAIAVESRKRSERFIYIQLLRFVAATSVVFFHSVGTAMKHIPDQSTFGYGFRGDHGVDIFFVISGFVICYSTDFLRTTSLDFLLRRLRRIVPIYWLLTLGMVAVSVLIPSAFSGTDWINPRSVLLSMTFLSFLDQKMPIIFVGWSLEYEMLFYATITILFFRALKAWDDLIIVFSLLSTLSISPEGHGLQALSSFLTNPMLLEFVYGVIIAKLFLGRRVSTPAQIVVLIPTLIVAVSDPTNRIVVAGLPSCLLVLAAAALSKLRQNPSLLERFFGALGDASYSIYLVQVFTISASVKVLGKSGAVSINLVIWVTTLVTIAIGYISYVGLERPLLQFFSHLRASRRDIGSLVESKPSHSGPAHQLVGNQPETDGGDALKKSNPARQRQWFLKPPSKRRIT
jgi:exopolysaccharide production protein ExoZ